MQLAIRNKWISIGGASIVTDMNEKPVLKVKGKFWTFTSKKFVCDLQDNVKYIVRNKFWRLFRYSAFVLDPNNNKVATIKRKIFSFHDRYFIESKYGEIEVTGNILCHDYHIYIGGKEVGHIARRISIRDSFVLEIADDVEDIYFIIGLVIAIDNITDRRRRDAANS